MSTSSALGALYHLSLEHSCMGGILISVPLIRKVRLRDKANTQGHVASEWQSGDSNPDIRFQGLCSFYLVILPLQIETSYYWPFLRGSRGARPIGSGLLERSQS